MADLTETSWVADAAGSPFPIQNLPYGVFSVAGSSPRIGAAIGSEVLDLSALAGLGLLPNLDGAFGEPSLNRFMAAGRPAWTEVRRRLGDLLCDPTQQPAVAPELHPLHCARLHLPFQVADFVDFYSSQDHATNLGRIFRPGSPSLPPAWHHLPMGYHGRAGTVVVSGTSIVRPSGQRQRPGGEAPDFGPTRQLDFEAEVGFVVGAGSRLGHQVPTSGLLEHVFGVVLVNDWSARDIQRWEYTPLGPFLGKSFATSISPWVVPLDALGGARCPPPRQSPPPLAYLQDDDPWALDLALEVRLNGELISRPPFGLTYWTPGQQLAHLTANGASLRPGDLFASGTVSGPARGERGSLIELAWNGAEPLTLADGSIRSWLADGDLVSISGWAQRSDGVALGFGEVAGVILSAP